MTMTRDARLLWFAVVLVHAAALAGWAVAHG